MESNEINGQLEAILSGEPEPLSGSNQDNLPMPKQDQPPPPDGVLCRLCAEPCGNISPRFLFKNISSNTVENALHNLHSESKSGEGAEVDNDDLMVLIGKTLPIKVSQSDPLPKQVCLKCVERLKENHSFVLSVINAESRLQSMVDTKRFCASQVSSKDDEPIQSPETLPAPGLLRVTLPSGPKFCCPLCNAGVVGPSSERPVPLVKKLVVPEKERWQKDESRNNVAWDGTIIKLEKDEVEPTPEELERSYRELFDVRDWRDVGGWRTETLNRRPWPRSQPATRRGYKGRPRGRPRGRNKMIPRGRRGNKRLTHTTVERLLELSGSETPKNNDVLRVRSGSDRLHADALTQCLLCEGWLPGMAACLQHALTNHTDCGVFLCPRCQQDDFPGEFELIQHFQEHHCPDLELCEVSDDDLLGASKTTTAVLGSCDSDIPQTSPVYSGDTDLTRPSSRLSNGTGSLVPEVTERNLEPEVTERNNIEINQNGNANENISQELILNSFLEHKDGEDFKEIDFAASQEAREISINSDVIPSITEEPMMAETEPNIDNEDAEEDREENDGPDTKSDTKFDYRKDPDDPEGGGGNSLSGNSNNLADDNSTSFENGDTSSQNTQPDSKSDHTDNISGTDCGNSLLLNRSPLSCTLSKQKRIVRLKPIMKRGANFGRKPKRKRLRSSILSAISKRNFRTAMLSKSWQILHTSKAVVSKTENKNCDVIFYPTITGLFRKRITQVPLYHWPVQRRKIA